MLSLTYELLVTEVDRRIWLYVAPRNIWSTSIDSCQIAELLKEFSTK